MLSDKRIIFIAIQAIIIIVLLVFLFRPKPIVYEEDPYVLQLKQQNKELEEKLTKLKQNYVEIGLADSLQTQNMDSLIAISTRKLTDLHEQISESRTSLEEMKKKKWDKLSEKQIDSEIQEAINFLANK